jgi:hypothetical protein
MASTIKVNNIQNQCGANIANKCGSTITLGASGDTITLACGASQTGFGRTGTVDWDTTAKTASFTAVSGTGYFVNTTSGAITVTMPATPSAGDIVALQDYAGTWGTNTVTIGRNGSNIGGITLDAILSDSNQSITLVYVDATRGWQTVNDSTQSVSASIYIEATGGTVTTSGNYKIHTFTSPGTFSVSAAAQCASDNVVSYMVVAGGGGGGVEHGGGGGAGGFREYKGPSDCYTASPLNGNPGGTAITVTETAYPITVGGGGTGGVRPGTNGGSGSNSIFSTITSAGGGGGGSLPNQSGISGGSGGGGNQSDGTTRAPGGTGNTPPVSPPQGNTGGTSGTDNLTFRGGGGGGGATAVGTESNPSGPSTNPVSVGCGGAGATTSISATPTAYAGGGGAGSTEVPGTGGTGGGGNGGTNSVQSMTSGTANTGGGGGASGGNCNGCGESGGSGIVIIRYKYQ